MLASILSVMIAFVMGGTNSAVTPGKVVHSPSPTPTPVSVAYGVPLSTVTIPTDCNPSHIHYTTAFNAPADSEVQGTADNDVIFAGSESEVHGGAGNDCIILNTESEGYGDGGNDILISNGGDNVLDGGAGNDTAYYHKLTDVLNGIETAIQL
jgi:Ca2+-binding RTX toxin-like protein